MSYSKTEGKNPYLNLYLKKGRVQAQKCNSILALSNKQTNHQLSTGLVSWDILIKCDRSTSLKVCIKSHVREAYWQYFIWKQLKWLMICLCQVIVKIQLHARQYQSSLVRLCSQLSSLSRMQYSISDTICSPTSTAKKIMW